VRRAEPPASPPVSRRVDPTRVRPLQGRNYLSASMSVGFIPQGRTKRGLRLLTVSCFAGLVSPFQSRGEKCGVKSMRGRGHAAGSGGVPAGVYAVYLSGANFAVGGQVPPMRIP